MVQKLHLLLWCLAAAILAAACLNAVSQRNAPLYKKLERQWNDDIERLEASGKLPRSWSDLRDVEIIGGTPETKDWLDRIKVPFKTRKDGHYHLEVLVVAWEEDGKRGAMVQYNIEDIKTRNNVWEQGRTFILSKPPDKHPWKAALEELM